MSNDSIQFKIVKSLPTEDVVDLYKEGGWWEEGKASREIIPSIIQGSFCFIVAFDGEHPIGMGRVISDGVSDGYIQDVIVKEKYRRLGIGGELIKRLTKFCVEHQLEWIALVAEPNTSSFYEKHGFQLMKDHHLMIFKGDGRNE